MPYNDPSNDTWDPFQEIGADGERVRGDGSEMGDPRSDASKAQERLRRIAENLRKKDAMEARYRDFSLPGYAPMDRGYADQLRRNQARLGNQDLIQMQARAGQSRVADLLDRQARGLGPSLADAQLRQSTDRNINMARAQANSASPGQQAMMQRLAMQQAGSLNQQAAGQASIAGIQERLGAANQAAGIYQGMRGQDQDMYRAGLGQEELYNRLRLEAAKAQQAGMSDLQRNETGLAQVAAGGKKGPGAGEYILGGLNAASNLGSAYMGAQGGGGGGGGSGTTTVQSPGTGYDDPNRYQLSGDGTGRKRFEQMYAQRQPMMGRY